ncbi:MAG: YjbQ family protein [Planctomycetota bacterium]|nr:MAG: YjbQ family protein [Planctomycetota bacterium]
MTTWQQVVISLRSRSRGFHLVSEEIINALPMIANLQCGLCHLLLQHTSASLLLNESYDPDVRVDLESWARRAAADDEAYYVHTLEGSDDMPAHIKSALFGTSLTLPIHQGRLALGTWQGIWLGEHRQHGGSRRIMATIHGQEHQGNPPLDE